MSVLFFTIFVSVALALFFGLSYLYYHDYASRDSLRDSLLPFGEERILGAGGKEVQQGAVVLSDDKKSLGIDLEERK